MSYRIKEYPNGISPRPPAPPSQSIKRIPVGDRTEQIRKSTRWMNNYGMYNLEDLSVRVVDDRHAVISYTKNEVNNSDHHVDVRVGFFDKLQGVTLEQKLQRVHAKTLQYMQEHNDTVLKNKNKSQALTERLRGN